MPSNGLLYKIQEGVRGVATRLEAPKRGKLINFTLAYGMRRNVHVYKRSFVFKTVYQVSVFVINVKMTELLHAK